MLRGDSCRVDHRRSRKIIEIERVCSHFSIMRTAAHITVLIVDGSKALLLPCRTRCRTSVFICLYHSERAAMAHEQFHRNVLISAYASVVKSATVTLAFSRRAVDIVGTETSASLRLVSVNMNPI